MTTAMGDTLTHSYDGLRRLSSVTNGMLTRQYSYRDTSNNSTTMQVSRVRYPEFDYNFDYTYDALGNIATYDSPWANPVTYTYDNQSQLLSASDGSTTYTYTYDAVGNIQSASNGTTTHSYTYGDADWKDLLTAFDNQSISYDASGNPTSYYNGKRWTMSWVNGRQLTSASDGTSTYSYIYDAAGSRIMKNVGTVNHLYFYVNGMLLMEYRYNAMGDTTDVLQYFYDANGKPHAMAYNGTVYLYVTNLQGDIVALLGLDGTVSGYEYDPYGNVIASYGDIAAINPLRYRGYYFDNETGLYYLQSRYYDPVVGRFINADSYASTGQGIIGFNMFAYCNNDPIIYTDDFGLRPVVNSIDGEEPEETRIWSLAYMKRPHVIDLTETLSSYMRTNAETLANYRESNGYIDAFFYFYRNVTDGGALDIKLQDAWKFEENKTYIFNGKPLRYDDPGNINFGYVGAVLFPELILCAGAGANHIKKWGFQFGDITTFYDDPRDNAMIKYGYSLYKEDNP